MSSGSSQSSSQQAAVDPELLDQTRTQIRGLVSRNRGSFALRGHTRRSFTRAFSINWCRRWRPKAVLSGSSAKGAGSSWPIRSIFATQSSPIAAKIRKSTAVCCARSSQRARARFRRLTPAKGTARPAIRPNTCSFLGPLRSDQEMQGVVEVFQRPNPRPAVERGYLRFVLQMCELAGDYLKTHRLRLFTDRQVMWTQLEQFTRLVHQGLDPRATAYTIANEGRRLIECDRVSVAIKRGGKRASRRSAARRHLTAARTRWRCSTSWRASSSPAASRCGTAATRRTWRRRSKRRSRPTSMSRTRKAMAILPLAKPTDTPRELAEEQTRQEFIGALIIEQITDEGVHARHDSPDRSGPRPLGLGDDQLDRASEPVLDAAVADARQEQSHRRHAKPAQDSDGARDHHWRSWRRCF